MTTMMATSAAGKKTSRFHFDLRSWLFWLIMAVWALPVVWLISMSLRDNADILAKFEDVFNSLKGQANFNFPGDLMYVWCRGVVGMFRERC